MRLLMGRNDLARQSALAELRSDPGRRVTLLPTLTTALDRHLEQMEKRGQGSLAISEIVGVIAMVNRDEAKQCVIKLLDSKEMRVAMLATYILGKQRIHEATDLLIKQADRPEFKDHYGFRFNLVRSLILIQDPVADKFLKELVRDLDGRLQYELMTALSENDDTASEQPQAELAENNAPENKAPENKSSEAKDELANMLAESKRNFSESHDDEIILGKSNYYGIPIRAKRLLFVIDTSGSMKEMTRYGTRLASAKRELSAAIKGLDQDAEFGVLFFSETVHSWQKDLKVATEENKAEAIKFVSKLAASKSTNTYGALLAATEFDDQLETVFLLTDGRPTCGDIVLPNLILNDIMRRNETRHLKFNTVGIAVADVTENFLRAIASGSDGEFRQP